MALAYPLDGMPTIACNELMHLHVVPGPGVPSPVGDRYRLFPNPVNRSYVSHLAE